MAATVTIEEVRAEGVSGTDLVINSLIDTANSADACIDAQGLTENQEKALKIYFIGWQLENKSRGGITSQTSKTGASQSYATDGSMGGFEKTFKAMAGSDCLLTKLSSDNSVYLGVVVPSYE